ncbi:PqiC family protein [Uliginosibacterium sp. 31-16]|uniref:PqiC family protein n=1 Tax=Uliginosibacterium sp. 31-16 TaxID=3068315 RepID=UPI00273DB2CB|nr:PqiC family protein [Uliginosibacterium sp. 31-16]MDP5239410.1 PqiC family protein [Uliginosibacterium sp. 31-16]
MKHFTLRLSATGLLVTLLAACSIAPPQAVHLYQLSPQAGASQTAGLNSSIGIGPLKWPDYLNRRQLVIRLDAGSIETAENDRWAEPLDAGFERVLRDNLVRQLNPQRLQSHPWPLNDAPAIHVPLEVLQFDTSAQGTTVLRARWRIVGRDRKELLGERGSEIRVQARDGSPPAAVAAQSEALARLSEEIGKGLLAAAK